jgi:hypothetical protein
MRNLLLKFFVKDEVSILRIKPFNVINHYQVFTITNLNKKLF